MTSRLMVVLAAAVAIAGACGSPTFPELNDTFNGTLQPQGVSWHQFVIQHPGDLSVTITKFDPLSGVTFGVGIGAIVGDTCGVTTTAVGRVNTPGLLSGAPGTYCVQLSDTGNVTEPVSYTIVLRHF